MHRIFLLIETYVKNQNVGQKHHCDKKKIEFFVKNIFFYKIFGGPMGRPSIPRKFSSKMLPNK